MFKDSFLRRRLALRLSSTVFLDDHSLFKENAVSTSIRQGKKRQYICNRLHSSNGLRNGEKRKNERRIGLDRRTRLL